jgi:hypothetical protein
MRWPMSACFRLQLSGQIRKTMNGKPNAPIDINGAMNKGFQPGEIIMKKHSFAPRSLLLAGAMLGAFTLSAAAQQRA